MQTINSGLFKNWNLNKSTLFWLVVCMCTILILQIGGQFPEMIDQFYHRGLFQGVRWIYDFSFGLLPFPVVYILFVGLLVLISKTIKRVIYKRTSLKEEILRALRFVAIVVSLFYVLWGWNYKQTPVERQLGLQMEAMTDIDIANEYLEITKELEAAILNVETQNWNIDSLLRKDFTESEARSAIESVLKTLGYPTGGRVRGRLLRPSGTLLIWNTAGIYIPFVAEGHIDRGLLPFQYPFVMTHEMAHGYGITDEGSCNFLAYLACRENKNPFIQLAGVLGYWRYVASDYRRSFPEKYKEDFKKLPPLLLSCLTAIHENNENFPELLPKFRYHAYDQYLKAQGIEEGMRNYARVVRLVHAWRKLRIHLNE
jgi:hypothetical protein